MRAALLSLSIAFAFLAFIYFVKGSNKTVAIQNTTSPVATDIESIEVPKNESVKLLFVGDIMFDRYIRQTIDKKGGEYVISGVKGIFAGNDFIVGNLEGPITDKPSISVDSEFGSRNNYIFTFDPKVTQILTAGNIKLVNIGNNHISNFGSDGIRSTKEYLMESGVDYFGDPTVGESGVVFKDVKGIKIAFVSYNQFVSNNKQKSLDGIAIAKKSGAKLIVMYTHWDKEFVSEPQERTRILAHEFIDNGADLIIGSHPHVIQSKEEYKGKIIYYSLGNFVFDQYFDPKTQEGLAVQVEILPDKKMQFKEYRVKMKNSGQTVGE
jgi:poly-gamma-glutamate synthesis protein (capsule biosynthesis protein)